MFCATNDCYNLLKPHRVIHTLVISHCTSCAYYSHKLMRGISILIVLVTEYELLIFVSFGLRFSVSESLKKVCFTTGDKCSMFINSATIILLFISTMPCLCKDW